MMWRWEHTEQETRNTQDLLPELKPEGFIDYDTKDEDGWRWSSIQTATEKLVHWYQVRTIENGYCGLAGKS